MLYGLWSSAAGGITQNARVDVIASNLANLETVGFRKDLMTFRARLAETREDYLDLHDINPVLDRIGGGLFADRTHWDHLQGPIEQTGRPLDVAIDGSGYFLVERNGRTYHTRAGNFAVDTEGVLRSADGAGLVLSSEGGEIRVTRPGEVLIDRIGVVIQAGEPIAQLALADVENPQDLVKVGDALFEYRGGAGGTRAAEARLVPGALERSGVSPVEEMTGMILALRAYESNMQMIRLQDQTLGRAVNDLGRIAR